MQLLILNKSYQCTKYSTYVQSLVCSYVCTNVQLIQTSQTVLHMYICIMYLNSYMYAYNKRSTNLHTYLIFYVECNISNFILRVINVVSYIYQILHRKCTYTFILCFTKLHKINKQIIICMASYLESYCLQVFVFMQLRMYFNTLAFKKIKNLKKGVGIATISKETSSKLAKIVS